MLALSFDQLTDPKKFIDLKDSLIRDNVFNLVLKKDLDKLILN